MRKPFLIILFLFVHQVNAQRMFFTMFFGGAGYKGDLQETTLSLIQAKPVAGIGLMYQFNSRMYLDVDFNIGRINGDDRFNPKNRARNLSFKSDIAEFSASFEYILFDLDEYKTSPYFFVGAGIFKFSPFVDLDNGARVYLADYNTEGQGFFQDRQKYKLTEWCIPFGAGLQWAITHNIRFAVSAGIRKTNTDYLDDVSTTYIDKDLLFQKMGTSAVIMAYKGDRMPNGSPYPASGTARGNPNDKDLYYFTGASLKFRLIAKGKRREQDTGVKRAKVTCPSL